MAFSYTTYTGNGSLTSYALGFNYLAETVVVSVDPKGIEVHLDDIKQTEGYTIDTSGNLVTFATAPANDVEIKILRVTPRGRADRLVDFADGTILTEAQLDTNALQLLYIAQEAFEQSSQSGGGTSTSSYLPYDSINAWWDAVLGGAAREIQNVKMGLLDNSAATKEYVDNVAEFGISGVPQAFTFTATGVTSSFTLSAAPQVEANMLVVALDGVLQVPGADFSVDGGAVNSTLIFTLPPTGGISVQNFGKFRYLDGLALTAGQVTTAALDQTAGTEAVSTETIRTGAITNAKIEASAVNFAQLVQSNWADASGTGHPRFMSMDPDVTVLHMDTLKTEDIEDFTTDIRAQNSINHFAAPTATWSNNGHGISGLPATPSADTHATSKTYVDDQISSLLADSGLVKLLVSETGGVSGNYIELTNWRDNAYKSYLFDCIGFELTDSTAAVAVEFQTGGSEWHNSAGDYTCSWLCNGNGFTLNAYHGFVTPRTGNTPPLNRNRESTITCHFQIEMPQNTSENSWRCKSVISRGFVAQAYTTSSSSGLPGPTTFGGGCDWVIKTTMNDTSAINIPIITGIRFRPMSNWQNTTVAGTLAGNRKIVVYGRTY